MRVLIAFDKFKGALSAPEACQHAAAVLRRARPSWQLDLAPLADGGDGFCSILTEAAGGVRTEQRASGALFSGSVPARWQLAPIGWVELARLPAAARTRLALPPSAARLAILEMAAINGLAQVPAEQRDVWRASTRGTGELLAAAAAQGADALLLGVGGSATSDLGLGALSALGLRCESAGGEALTPLPESWPQIARVAGKVRALPPLRIACDVRNPLLGPQGAAAIYGPQKGLGAAELCRFEAQAERLARLLCAHAGADPARIQEPGAGAAGGIAFGLAVAAGARLVAGFPLVAEWLDLERRRAQADWVLTGEGCFDATSLAGKGPGALLHGAGARCAVFAGSVALSAAERASLPGGTPLIAISPAGQPLEQALPATARQLERALEQWLDRVSG